MLIRFSQDPWGLGNERSVATSQPASPKDFWEHCQKHREAPPQAYLPPEQDPNAGTTARLYATFARRCMPPKGIDRLCDPVKLASLMQVPMLFLVHFFLSPSPRTAACVSYFEAIRHAMCSSRNAAFPTARWFHWPPILRLQPSD